MNTHPIADMLTRIRNAAARRFLTVRVPASRFKEAVGQLLVANGWLEKCELVKADNEHPYLLLTLKYQRNNSIIRGIKMISKSGQRIYMNKAQLIKSLPNQLETVVVSTSAGLMNAREAQTAGLGGEVLFKIW